MGCEENEATLSSSRSDVSNASCVSVAPVYVLMGVFLFGCTLSWHHGVEDGTGEKEIKHFVT